MLSFVISGEGSSDLGILDNNGDLKKGPLFHLLEYFAGTFDFEYRTEQSLSEFRHVRPKVPVRGDKHPDPDMLVFSRGAEALASFAKRKGDYVAVIYFRDSDRHRWETVVSAMEKGFSDADFKYGVPMVPKPKSEAWFLCHYQDSRYQNCKRFEEYSGNDSSPKSLKRELRSCLKLDGHALYMHISSDESIKWDSIDMPSFNLFKKRLKNVVCALEGRPFDYPPDETFIKSIM